jgi:hypothetical protein
MQKIPISLAAPGMVLAADIRSSGEAGGRILCGRGVSLTDSLIGRLRQMGIESVAVEGRPVKMEGELTIDDMLTALNRRFSRVADDPLMMKIKDMYRRQIERSMGE